MSRVPRRKFLSTGLAAAAGASGLTVAAKVAQTYGLIPPDGGGIYGPGETLTYGAQRLLTHGSFAREFDRSRISNPPFANAVDPLGDVFKRLQDSSFTDWRLELDGMVARAMSFSLADLRSFPAARQVTHLACEEGWSYIAEWIGVPLSDVLNRAGIVPAARYVIYRSIQPDWWESIDMADALHPQTLVAYGMNGGELPVGFGGPLRLRVPRQLGYKSVKYITRITVSDNANPAVEGPGGSSAETWHGSSNRGYAWYAGI
jgi:DMSO/TMAO reductase YedYZ molybdopterin-dependent catalytic subunit